MLELLLIIILGVLWGLVFGVIPTAGPTTALLTSYAFFPLFYDNPYLGVAFYTAMIAACTTGDTWSSILLGIPGQVQAPQLLWTDILWHKKAKLQWL